MPRLARAHIREGRAMMLDSGFNPTENKTDNKEESGADPTISAPVPVPVPVMGPSCSPMPYPLESLSIALPLADGLLRCAMAP